MLVTSIDLLSLVDVIEIEWLLSEASEMSDETEPVGKTTEAVLERVMLLPKALDSA